MSPCSAGELFDDGLLWLDAEAMVVDRNAEAARLLGCAAGDGGDGRGVELAGLLGTVIEGREALLDAVVRGRRADVPLRVPGGARLLASTRRAAAAGHVALVLLRDLDAFDYRRERALGTPHDERLRAGTRGSGHPRPPPDFAAQRRLSPALNRLLSRGERAVAEGARVLVRGESGVGKSAIARHLHGSVADARDPFVVANCAALPGAAFERALFGEPADDAADTLLARAAGGTLFLDEVGELSAVSQARLLGLLDEGFADDPAGGGPTRDDARRRGADTRVIAASARDLGERVRAGTFRSDLYYRLAVVELAVPPLRDTPELVAHLAGRFLRTINRRRRDPVLLPRRLLDILEDYSFPGNVRELQNLVQRATIFIDDAEDMASLVAELLDGGASSPNVAAAASAGASGAPRAAASATTPADAAAMALAEASPTLDLRAEVRRHERALIDRAIRLHGSKRKAAAALGVDIATVSRKTATPPDPAERQVPSQESTRR